MTVLGNPQECTATLKHSLNRAGFISVTRPPGAKVLVNKNIVCTKSSHSHNTPSRKKWRVSAAAGRGQIGKISGWLAGWLTGYCIPSLPGWLAAWLAG